MAVSVSNTATQAVALRRHRRCSSSRLPIETLSLGGCKGGYSLSSEREYPPLTPKRKGFDRQSRARRGFLPPECNCLRGGIADAHRHWFCYTTCLCFYYPLPLSNLVSVRCNRLLSKVRISRQAPTMLPWQAEANLHKSKVDGDCVRVANCRQSDSEDRR